MIVIYGSPNCVKFCFVGRQLPNVENHRSRGFYRAFHGFGQAKLPEGVSVLGSSQFSILPQLPPNILLDSKMVKIDSKIIISLRKSKSVKNSVSHREFEIKSFVILVIDLTGYSRAKLQSFNSF